LTVIVPLLELPLLALAITVRVFPLFEYVTQFGFDEISHD
jgi:hypothetical protein